LQSAQRFHTSKLKTKTILSLQKLIEQKSLNEYLVNKFRQQSLKTRLYDNLKKAYAISRTEREIKENQIVDNFKQYMLKKRVLTAFKNIPIIEHTEALKLREHCMKRRSILIIQKWKELIPQLRQENLIREDKLQVVVDKFRTSVLGPKVIKAWRKYTYEAQQDKEKQKFQKEMWSKVSGWLDEIDEKHSF